MALPLTSDAHSSIERAQNDKAGYGMHTQRATAFAPNARNLQIVDSTLSVVGGDVHNHYHYSEPTKDIWAFLRSIPNFRNIYQDMLSKATPGTGMWLVKGDKFRLWLEPNGDIKIFWGSGIPGAGKTLLATIVIERLEALRRESDAAICICYVYFRYSDHAELTVRNVLEILIKQTLQRHSDCRALIEQSYLQHLWEGSQPTEMQLLGLLQELAGRMACTFYVLDALDEAPTKIQPAVVKALESLDVKLFITSRSLKTVEENFPDAYALSIAAQDDDIDLHITKVIGESADLQHLLPSAGPALKEEIISTIKQNCGGMFLHAALQLDALSECLNARDVRNTLKAFPSSIEDVYRRTWARILKQGPSHAHLAKTVLVWVLHASRSMTVHELGRAAAVSPTTCKFEPDRVVPGSTLVSLCRGLVTVEEESNIVRLVRKLHSNPHVPTLIYHPTDYTAQGTLEALLQDSFPQPHSLLATMCMAHLTGCHFQSTTISSEEELRTALGKDPLLAYASDAWAFHARAGLDVEETKRRTARFVIESDAFPAFTSLDRTWYFDILTPLHMLGLYHLPTALIEGAIMGNPNAMTTVHNQSPLIVASWSGHEGITELLLANPEIQANLVDDEGWSALMSAARNGHTDIIALLLAHPGIQVNSVNNEGWSALMQAAYAGHGGAVKLLLAFPKTQVNLINHHGSSALTLATYEGHEETVKLLLACAGILINLVDNDGWSALLFAAKYSFKGVIKLLLTSPGIQVNLVSEDGSSALMMAAEHGHVGIVELLLAHFRIQANLVDNDGWSALMLASHAGHKGVVKLLLAHAGIQVNLVKAYSWSALMLAANKGREGVVELLLTHPRIQVNRVKDGGSTALTLAAYQGNDGVVKLLLLHPEIQANLLDNEDWSALMLAVSEGHNSVVRLLLSVPGIQVNQVSNNRWSVLTSAAKNGNADAAKLLLTHPEIQVNLVNSNGWSALMLAARHGYSEIAELLLMHPEIQSSLMDDHSSTALLLAAEFDHKPVVELLLTTGDVDINAFDNDMDTALKMSAEKGHEAIVRRLLDMPDIDIAIRSITDGHTAMSGAQANGHGSVVELLQTFESRRAMIAKPTVASEGGTNEDEDGSGSDSDSFDCYYDAQEGQEWDVGLRSSLYD